VRLQLRGDGGVASGKEIIMADDKLMLARPIATVSVYPKSMKIRDWTKSLGVSEEELREAVDAVGNAAEKVRNYLKAR
jgi:hypothetical protein